MQPADDDTDAPPIPTRDTPETLRFREQYGRLNGAGPRTRLPEPRPAPRMPAGDDPDATVRISLADIRAMLDADRAASPAPRGVGWSTVVVICWVAPIVCALIAVIAYLILRP